MAKKTRPVEEEKPAPAPAAPQGNPPPQTGPREIK